MVAAIRSLLSLPGGGAGFRGATMPRFPFLLVAVTILAGCSPVAPKSDLAVVDGWARATAPGQSSGAVYATIVNRGGDDRLLSVKAQVAAMAMVHASDNQGGVARMRMVEALRIPAGSTVTLAPGGTHIMLQGLSAPLEAGGRVQLDLRFEHAGQRHFVAAIVAPGAR